MEEIKDLGFPKDLLNQNINERIQYFDNYAINHPILRQTYDKVMNNIYLQKEFPIILVAGPTGVGKSTLIKKLKQQILKNSIEIMNRDKGMIPIGSVEAIAPDDAKFDWKDFYIRALDALEEPLIDFKIDYDT